MDKKYVKFKKDRTKTCRGGGVVLIKLQYPLISPTDQTHFNSLISYTSGDN